MITPDRVLTITSHLIPLLHNNPHRLHRAIPPLRQLLIITRVIHEVEEPCVGIPLPRLILLHNAGLGDNLLLDLHLLVDEVVLDEALGDPVESLEGVGGDDGLGVYE